MTAPANFTGVTVDANGANGTDADVFNAGGAAHGPGGGGGGGVVVDSGGIAAHDVNGGAAGRDRRQPDARRALRRGGRRDGQLFALRLRQRARRVVGRGMRLVERQRILIGPVGVPNATGSYDGNVATTNNNDFVEKSFAPAGVQRDQQLDHRRQPQRQHATPPP